MSAWQESKRLFEIYAGEHRTPTIPSHLFERFARVFHDARQNAFREAAEVAFETCRVGRGRSLFKDGNITAGNEAMKCGRAAHGRILQHAANIPRDAPLMEEDNS